MKNYINELYKSLEELDFEKFDEIYEGIREGEIIFDIQNIVSLCKIFTCKFKDMEPDQEIKTYSMTFLTIDRYGLENGLKLLIEGLDEIYKKSLVDTQVNKLDFDYDDYIDEYIGMFVNSYEEGDMILFGQLISAYPSEKLKMKLLELLKKDLKEYGEQEQRYINKEYLKKGEILLENIKL